MTRPVQLSRNRSDQNGFTRLKVTVARGPRSARETRHKALDFLKRQLLDSHDIAPNLVVKKKQLLVTRYCYSPAHTK